MGEKRNIVRQKSFLRGRLYFNRGHASVDCLIRDISKQGARVVVSDALNLPAVVDLHIPQKERTLKARVLWRHGNAIGLSFAESLPAPGGSAPSSTLMLRMLRLEAELASQRRIVKQLRTKSDLD
jgi:hypothetical protein